MRASVIHALIFLLLLHWGCDSKKSIEFVEDEHQIAVFADGRLITQYIFNGEASKPILYPLYAPSGEVVTRDYPLKEVEGESREHAHHTGVYFTYGSNGEVNGNSFWYNPHDRPPLSPGPKQPEIRHVEIVELDVNKKSGKISALNYWIDKNNKPILEESRTMEFSAPGQEYIIDFTIYLTALDTTVTFEDTKEGMFAIRVADWLAEKSNGTLYEGTGEYLNAEGDKTEKHIWGKRSSWVRLEGEKEGKPIGVAIFHHPESLNYPAYWHARSYGCFGANPIGRETYQRQRENRHEKPGERTLTLNPGERALFKFRLMVYEGMRDIEHINNVFLEFSKN